MRYAEINDLSRYSAADHVAACFEIRYPVARAIVEACRQAYELGAQGNDPPEHLASRDLKELVHDAWHDGIIGRKLVVKLESRKCDSWGPDIAEDHSNCEDCGGTGRSISALATVTAPYAEEWCDWNQSIGGSSWEAADQGMSYAMPVDHPGLVEELRAEGYTLDLSQYEAP